MNICAVICELNPMHNGHKYVFEQAKKLTGCDRLLAIMSGNFCQRAIPAITNMYTRAEAALLCGADIVLELPVVYATAAGDMFANGAVGILNTIPGIKSLVMGSECGDKKFLEILASIQAEESRTFKSILSAALDSGKSYAKALTLATATEAGLHGLDKKTVIDALNSPNNVLAVSYKKMLLLSDSGIAFETVKRQQGIPSASKIREYFSGEITELTENNLKDAMPQPSYFLTIERLKDYSIRRDEYNALLLYALRGADVTQIAATPDCAEGLEHKIKKAAMRAKDYDEFITSCGAARYTTGRIKRICLHTLLGITKEMQHSGYNFSRVLGVRKDSLNLLSIMPDNIVKNHQFERLVPSQFTEILETEKKACRIYSQITHSSGDGYYKQLIKV